MTASTRRAALGAILTAPLTGGAVMALPSDPPQRGAPSDLAQACDWGVSHLAWINNPAIDDREWPDDRLQHELGRVDGVLERLSVEPSATRADLVAKVRLILASDGEYLSLSDCANDRAVLTVLREVLTLCA